jgi:excisionase family DNA binding protein
VHRAQLGARRACESNHQQLGLLAAGAGAETSMKTWLTVAEAAAYAGISRDTVYTACERRELRHARIGGRRSIRLKPEWIDAWLEQHARGAQGSANAIPGQDHTATP